NAPQTPTSSCSKGSRGLSVQPRVLGIFTETTVSPDPSLRQRPSRYAIRAGRNFALFLRFRRRRLSLHLGSVARVLPPRRIVACRWDSYPERARRSWSGRLSFDALQSPVGDRQLRSARSRVACRKAAD